MVLEGVDHSSNLPLSISYRAPPHYSVITSISTLVAKLVEEGESIAEAEAFGVSIPLTAFRYRIIELRALEEVFTRGEEAQKFILRATQLSNLLNEGSRFLQMKTGGKLNRVRGADLIVTAIKEKIFLKAGRRNGAVDPSFDLVDSSNLLEMISTAESLASNEIEQIEDFGIFCRILLPESN